jgi:hypothetical protein
LFVKSKSNQSAEYTRTLLKSKVNPTQIKLEELESYTPTFKNPRIIVFNITEDIASENAAQAKILQNSELNLDEN